MKALITTIITLFCICYCSSIVWADEIDSLVPAIIEVESGGNPNAISPQGAVGLMQITPIVVAEYQQVEGRIIKGPLYDSQVNIEYGDWYLRRLKDHYLKDHYTIERLLAAYNGGPTRLKKVGYNINRMPKETRDYVRKVMKIYSRLEVSSND